MEEPKKELILVYNANSGFYNMIKDALHKSISPNTYSCNLCGLTFGTIRMKSKWKKFIKNLLILNCNELCSLFYLLFNNHITFLTELLCHIQTLFPIFGNGLNKNKRNLTYSLKILNFRSNLYPKLFNVVFQTFSKIFLLKLGN